jgi:hypothetical protein
MNKKQRKLQAQVNGAKAAGTKSPAGLQISSKNAIRHGLTSKTLVLSNESQAIFEQLRDSYIAKFQPQDDVEMDLVHEMVAALWRLRRMRGIETALFDLEMDRQEEDIEKDFSHIDEPTRTAVAYTSLANNSNTLSLYLRYESTFRRSFDRALANLLHLRATLSAPTDAPTAGTPDTPAAPKPVPIAAARVHPETPTESAENKNYETTPTISPKSAETGPNQAVDGTL